MDFSKLLHGFVKFITWISQSCSICFLPFLCWCFICTRANPAFWTVKRCAEVFFGQNWYIKALEANFELSFLCYFFVEFFCLFYFFYSFYNYACWNFCLEQNLLNESKYLMPWVCCAFNNFKRIIWTSWANRGKQICECLKFIQFNMRQGGEHHWGGANVLLQPFRRVQGARSIECPNKMPSLNKILQVGLDLGMNKGCQGESAKNSMYTCLRWWSSSYEQFMSSWSSKSRTRVFGLTQQWNFYQSECFEGQPPGKSNMIGVDFKLHLVTFPPIWF